MREEKVKQLRKIFEAEKNLTINDILDGLEHLESLAPEECEMEKGDVLRVPIKGSFAYLDLMQTYTDSYQVGLVYKGHSFILSEAIIDRSSVSAFYESRKTAFLKAEEFIKSLDEQQYTEPAGEAEINAICKATAEFQKKLKFPEWIKWLAIDSDGGVLGFAQKPEIRKQYKEIFINPTNPPLFFGYISSMEGIDWRKSCVSKDKVLQRIYHNEEHPSECEPSYVKERETIETLTERVNKQEEVIIGLLRFMHDKKFQFDKCSDTRSCGALFEKCDEYLKKLGSTPYEYQKKKINFKIRK